MRCHVSRCQKVSINCPCLTQAISSELFLLTHIRLNVCIDRDSAVSIDVKYWAVSIDIG